MNVPMIDKPMDAYERERLARQKAEEVAHVISDYLNCYGEDRATRLVEALLLDHRSLQQSFTRFCMRWFSRLAVHPHGYDGRNEASVKLAQTIMSLPESQRRLPLI